MIRAVVFDLGGVIVQITLDVAEAAARSGLSIDAKCTFPDLDFFLCYQRGTLSCQEYLTVLAQQFSLTTAEAQRLHAGILVAEYPGISGMIANLNEAGLKTAVLSNTNELHWQEMKSGRWSAFDLIQLPLGSHEVNLEKPQVEFYRELEVRLGVNPEEIIFFDDGEKNVLGAKEAGWQAHLIDPAGDTAAQIRIHLGVLVPHSEE
ncbi:MAG: HAD-IA family hydrolase [Fimbriimonadaceae bacterium]